MGRKRKSDPRGKKPKKTTSNLSELKRAISNLLDADLSATLTQRQIKKRLGIHSRTALRDLPYALDELQQADKIKMVGKGNYASTSESKGIVGTVDFVSSRFAFIVNPETEQDVFVKAQDLKFALDGDTVEVVITSTGKGGRPEGKVQRIVQRARTRFVGRLEVSENFAFMVPDSKKMHQDIFVPIESAGGAKNNDKVIVEITEWPSFQKNPKGKIVDVLGAAGENDAEIHSIMAEFDLPFKFDPHLINAAEKIPDDLTDAEYKKRRDMRKVTTFTIDPEDAKDFDDALSIRDLDNGRLEIGIHIADVTHYVRPGTPIEEEGYSRATSVYLVDRTIPMLPERLSNELCSLRPHEDKLSFSAIFEMDESGKVYKEWFGRTVIHSDRRFAYEDAQEGIETGKGDYAKELQTLNAIAKKMRAKRYQEGAINFETTEVKFRLDEKGKPLEVIPKVRKDAHKMIEEFMLLANKKVATFIFNKGKNGPSHPFVYRTHDDPDPEKIASFALFAGKFGHKLNLKASIAHELNRLMEEIVGKPEENVLQQLGIRSMAKAKYTTAEKGHFGLSFDHYTHFTSPIRRYPDMMVHRLLQHYLNNGAPVSKEEYEPKCLHSSEMEKRASDAERASIKYKQAEFMSDKVGEVFEGIISGVTEWGIFVELVENKCEGMVRVSQMMDDFYEFDDRNMAMVGRHNKVTYGLGESVTVRVTGTNLNKRTVDLEFKKD